METQPSYKNPPKKSLTKNNYHRGFFLKESLLPVLTHNYRRRPRHGTVEKGYEDGISPDFLLLSANKAQFAEKRKGHEGVGPSHCQIAGDLLQLAQTGLQLSGNVVCKTAQVASLAPQPSERTSQTTSRLIFSTCTLATVTG